MRKFMRVSVISTIAAVLTTLLAASTTLASCGAQSCVLDLRGPEESAARYSFGIRRPR